MKKFIFLIVVLPFVAFSQNIKGTFSPAEDYTYAFLYRATPNGANYIERGKLNDAGSFEITLDSTAKPGIYKIVYAIPPEENNFDFGIQRSQKAKLEIYFEEKLPGNQEEPLEEK